MNLFLMNGQNRIKQNNEIYKAMTIEKTPIEGLLVLQTENHEDNRGSFQKFIKK